VAHYRRVTLLLLLGVLSLPFVRPSIAETIQLQQRGGGYLIRGQLNGAVTVDFILDTGASDVAIPGEVAEALMRAGTLTSKDFLGTQTYVPADGSRVPSKRFILREVKVGDQTVRNVTDRREARPCWGRVFSRSFPPGRWITSGTSSPSPDRPRRHLHPVEPTKDPKGPRWHRVLEQCLVTN